MIYLPAQMCRDLAKASQREWLETNGLGGFALSTITGLNTRRYHGLLCAALDPPSKRFLLLSKVEETLVIDGRRFELGVNSYPGTIYPAGYQFQISFRKDPFPAFAWQIEDVELTKQVFLVHDSDTVVVHYFVKGNAGHDVKLETRPLLAYRGFHELTYRNDALRGECDATSGRVAITPYDTLPTLHFSHDAVQFEQTGDWYYNFQYEMERARGLDYMEDLFQPFVLHYDLNARPQASLMASLESHDIATVAELQQREIARRKSAGGKLAAAADQFIVKRGRGHSIIAGYPWFGDWGRDTMISLPGLTLGTAHSALAKEILEEFSHWIADGLLPNTFPDRGEQPQYNSVDSALWYFEAVRAYAEHTGDYDWVSKRIYGALADIVDAYVRGTRYHIQLDTDGLVHAGEDGVALTWMDARLNGVPVTPRIGKPVEIQALWYNALRIMESLAARHDGGRKDYYASLAETARASFRSKFWNGPENCLFDVVEVNGGKENDASIRPNQVFAVSLTHQLLEPGKALQVLDVVERELLTPFGLRTLSPKDPQYRGTYSGDMVSRDSAYHQGTVWPWLMGPFAVAYFEAHERNSAARQRSLQWLSPLREYRTGEGMDQLPEVFDGDPPHRPGGCPAQAWSLACMIQSFLTVY